jgi:hypothetical protein
METKEMKMEMEVKIEAKVAPIRRECEVLDKEEEWREKSGVE